MKSVRKLRNKMGTDHSKVVESYKEQTGNTVLFFAGGACYGPSVGTPSFHNTHGTLILSSTEIFFTATLAQRVLEGNTDF